MSESAKKPGEISASIMCADISNLVETLDILESENVEYLHMDVMDGHFVPNFALGMDHIKKIREISNIPMDFHLMITDPEEKIGWFNFGPGDCVIVHYESTRHIIKALEAIQATGAKPGIALNPGTPIFVLDEILDFIDIVAAMTVNPGFAGQQIVPGSIDKVARLKKYLIEKGHPDIEIEVDGNISFENAKLLRERGADIFVAGTSSVFGDMDRHAAINKLRESII
ncbi:MAG: ribulose-phosphate 3-epimerase [Coriobacteriia bacterium]|nr:ribulose-phosphate 3-epimerase [Coriobacteriia bacterium]